MRKRELLMDTVPFYHTNTQNAKSSHVSWCFLLLSTSSAWSRGVVKKNQNTHKSPYKIFTIHEREKNKTNNLWNWKLFDKNLVIPSRWWLYPAKIFFDILARWPIIFCFWKPMHTNATSVYIYICMSETQLNPLQVGATQHGFFARISYSVQPVWLQSGKHLPSNIFSINTLCKKHDWRMVVKKTHV